MIVVSSCRVHTAREWDCKQEPALAVSHVLYLVNIFHPGTDRDASELTFVTLMHCEM